MPRQHVTYTTERLSALSDGVFVIVLTLLVLDLKIPRGAGLHFDRDLIGQVPNFITWIIRFILVARVWLVHHAVLARLAACHVWTLTWNLVVLTFCSLVPCGASLIGEYDWNLHAIIVFSAILACTAIALGLFARHAARDPHLHRDQGVVGDLRCHWRYHVVVIPLLALLSAAIVWLDRQAAILVWLVEPPIAFSLLWARERRT